MVSDVDPAWWDDETFDGRPIREALARRDISAVFRFLRRRGFSRARLAALTGLSETRVRQIWTGKQQVCTYEVLERIAHGLRIPRAYIGIAYIDDTNVGVHRRSADGSAVGLLWQASLRDTVNTVAELWRADMQRRTLLYRSSWLTAALAAPTRDWLLDMLGDEPASPSGRPIGQPEVDTVWAMCGTFTDADHRLGGGYARAALGQYVTEAVLPMLADGRYDTEVGRSLMAAAARVCDLGGFMAFDCGLHGLAQRYFIQALRLAQSAGERTMGGHILGDMAMQAHELGEAKEAIALASAGLRTAVATGSSATVARCHALLARAYASQGDGRGCDQSMLRAEDALDRVNVSDEPAWTRFFTVTQLHAEFTYAAAELGRYGDVQRLAPAVIAESSGMERRQVLLTAALAASYLPDQETGSARRDVAQACATLEKVVPALDSMATQRGRRAVTAARRRLRPYSGHPAVRQLDTALSPVS